MYYSLNNNEIEKNRSRINKKYNTQCAYICLLDNGTSYYTDDQNYYSIDNNNKLKSQLKTDKLLLNEFNNNSEIQFLHLSEAHKISQLIEKDIDSEVKSSDNIFYRGKYYTSIKAYMKYIDSIKLNPFDNKENKFYTKLLLKIQEKDQEPYRIQGKSTKKKSKDIEI